MATGGGEGGREDGEEALFFVGLEVGVASGGIGAVKNGGESDENGVVQWRGEGGEGIGVDEKTAAIREEAVGESKVFESVAGGAAGSVGGEGVAEGVGAGDAGGERGGAAEEKVIEHVFRIGGEGAGEAVGGGIFGEEAADAVRGAGEAVVHRELVLEDEQGDDVAGRGEVAGGVEGGGEVGGTEGARGEVELAGVFAGESVAAVRGRAGVAGDIPAAPAVGEGRGVVDEIFAKTRRASPSAAVKKLREKRPGISRVGVLP